MRNLFDQYTQPENRLTHALVSTLDRDRRLLRPFLRWAGAQGVPHTRDLYITEQQVPGNPVSGRDEERGLPDGCVYSDDGWALIMEAKVQAGSVVDQLRRHIGTARRHGFDKPYVLLLSVDDAPHGMSRYGRHRKWCDLYSWFASRAHKSPLARMLTTYMETFESQMIALKYSIRGTITMFDGLRFDAKNPFTYREGKRLIRLLGDELQRRDDLARIGIDKKAPRRPAITGSSASYVWDILPHKAAQGTKNFTSFPHFTISLHQEHAEAAITVPNNVRGDFRTRLANTGEKEFMNLLASIERRLRPVLRRAKGSKPLLRALQRHYRSQRSLPETDARIDADLRTMLPGSRGEPKFQPEWGRAVFDVVTHKRSNVQLQLVVQFPYTSPRIRGRTAVDLFAGAWKAMSPIADFVLDY
jgi:hypothetical protein